MENQIIFIHTHTHKYKDKRKRHYDSEEEKKAADINNAHVLSNSLQMVKYIDDFNV